MIVKVNDFLAQRKFLNCAQGPTFLCYLTASLTTDEKMESFIKLKAVTREVKIYAMHCPL